MNSIPQRTKERLYRQVRKAAFKYFSRLILDTEVNYPDEYTYQERSFEFHLTACTDYDFLEVYAYMGYASQIEGKTFSPSIKGEELTALIWQDVQKAVLESTDEMILEAIERERSATLNPFTVPKYAKDRMLSHLRADTEQNALLFTEAFKTGIVNPEDKRYFTVDVDIEDKSLYDLDSEEGERVYIKPIYFVSDRVPNLVSYRADTPADVLLEMIWKEACRLHFDIPTIAVKQSIREEIKQKL